MAYNPINWQNGVTPLNDANLNKMDSAIAKLDSKTTKLSEVVTEVVKGKADVILANKSGESFHLTDTTDSKAVEFALHGKATQKQYSGKNLLKTTAKKVTYDSVTITANNDSSVNFNGVDDGSTSGTAFSIGANLSELPNGEYILSVDNDAVTLAWLKMVFENRDDISLYLSSSHQEQIFKITDEIKAKELRFTWNTGATFNNTVVKPMIRRATETDNTWEPYVGGKPTPNPDWPMEINVAGAGGDVEVKSSGKNLIPYPYYEKNHTDNGITWTVNEDGKVIANGTASATSNEILSNVNIQGIKLPSGKYLLTGCPAGGSSTTYRMWANRIVGGSQVGFGSDFGDGLFFELSEETYVGVGCQIYNGTSVSNLIFEPMISLEGGEYESYKESSKNIITPNGLAGIKVESGGNYVDASGQQWVTDEIVKYTDGTGKKIQRIGHKTYNGTENIWRRVANETYSTVFYGDNSLLNTIGNRDCLSNRFVDTKLPIAQVTSGYTYYNLNSNMIYFAYGENSEDNTLEGWKAFLASNNLSFYYVLSEPIITDLTADEIAELEVQTFYPTTNILNDSNCGMEVTYLADTKNYIDKIIGDRISALESALINNI